MATIENWFVVKREVENSEKKIVREFFPFICKESDECQNSVQQLRKIQFK